MNSRLFAFVSVIAACVIVGGVVLVLALDQHVDVGDLGALKKLFSAQAKEGVSSSAAPVASKEAPRTPLKLPVTLNLPDPPEKEPAKYVKVPMDWDAVKPSTARVRKIVNNLRVKNDKELQNDSGLMFLLSPEMGKHGQMDPSVAEKRDEVELDRLTERFPWFALEIAEFGKRIHEASFAHDWYVNADRLGEEAAREQFDQFGRASAENASWVALTYAGIPGNYTDPTFKSRWVDPRKAVEFILLGLKGGKNDQSRAQDALDTVSNYAAPNIVAAAWRVLVDVSRPDSDETRKARERCLELATYAGDPSTHGRGLWRFDGVDVASHECKTALEAFSEDGSLWVNYALTLSVKKSFTKARIAFARAAQMGSEFSIAMYWGFFGNQEIVLGMLDREAEAGNKWADLNYGEVESWKATPREDVVRGRLEKAERAGLPVAAISLGQFYERQKQFDKALEGYKRVSVDQPVATLFIGRIYSFGLGVPRDLDQAKKWYDEAVKQNPRNETRLAQIDPGFAKTYAQRKDGPVASNSARFSIDGFWACTERVRTSNGRTVEQQYAMLLSPKRSYVFSKREDDEFIRRSDASLVGHFKANEDVTRIAMADLAIVSGNASVEKISPVVVTMTKELSFSSNSDMYVKTRYEDDGSISEGGCRRVGSYDLNALLASDRLIQIHWPQNPRELPTLVQR